MRWHQRYRPPVGDLPVLWKELIVDGSLRMNWAGWIAVLLLVLLTLGIGVWIVLYFFWEQFFNGNAFRGGPGLFDMMNVWVRIAATGVACLTLLGVAVRASTTIRSEIDKDTFDALVTTPLPSNAILLGKFVGSLFSVRLGWFWLGAILGLGVLTGGLHMLALPLFLGAWTVYAIIFAMIGLWFSMVSRTSMRADRLHHADDDRPERRALDDLDVLFPTAAPARHASRHAESLGVPDEIPGRHDAAVRAGMVRVLAGESRP